MYMARRNQLELDLAPKNFNFVLAWCLIARYYWNAIVSVVKLIVCNDNSLFWKWKLIPECAPAEEDGAGEFAVGSLQPHAGHSSVTSRGTLDHFSFKFERIWLMNHSCVDDNLNDSADRTHHHFDICFDGTGQIIRTLRQEQIMMNCTTRVQE